MAGDGRKMGGARSSITYGPTHSNEIYLLHCNIFRGIFEIIVLTLQLILFLFIPVRIYVLAVEGSDRDTEKHVCVRVMPMLRMAGKSLEL